MSRPLSDPSSLYTLSSSTRKFSSFGLRALAVASVAAASALAGTGESWASAGCTALNGALAVGFNYSGNFAGTGFDAGDVITFSETSTSGSLYLYDSTSGTRLTTEFFGVGTVTYTVPATTTHLFFLNGNTFTTTTRNWSCVSAPASAASTDSQKLRSLQQSVTPLAAITSAQAITGAIDRAINDAFGNGGTPFSGGPGGFAVNFAAEPQSKVEEGTKDAFSALAYAGDKKNAMPIKAPPLSTKLDKEWSLWADVRGTGWSDNNGSSGLNGRQINVTAGLGRKLTPDWLVGVVAGYEDFNYDVSSLTGTLKGHGGTVGGYTAYKILPSLRWDAALAWSRVNYDASAGTASGSFTGDRWIASTGLTGTYRVATFIVEPSSKVFALWEKQNEYTDSLGTLQAANNFSAGRVSTGGKVIYPWQLNNGWTLSPYAGLYGDWRFGSNTTSSGDAIVGISNGWSARVTGGVSIAQIGGGSLALGGEYGGLGADYKLWTATARASLPF